MANRKMRRFTLALVLLLGLASATYSQLYETDFPIDLPPYDRLGLNAGVTGRISVEITFKEGRVKSLKVLESQLRLPENSPLAEGSARELFLDRLRDRTVEPLRNWRSYVLSPYRKIVAIHLKSDESLRSHQRRYDLEYDLNDGVPVKLVIRGGPSDH